MCWRGIIYIIYPTNMLSGEVQSDAGQQYLKYPEFARWERPDGGRAARQTSVAALKVKTT
jgi:hypothetical protein